MVPVHPGEEIGCGLLRKIIRDAGVPPEEFMEAARRSRPKLSWPAYIPA